MAYSNITSLKLVVDDTWTTLHPAKVVAACRSFRKFLETCIKAEEPIFKK